MMRRTVMALALAGGVAAASAPLAARAAPSLERSPSPIRPPSRAPLYIPPYIPPPHPRSALAEHAGADPAWHPFAVPPDLDHGRRDGHMTPEERRLLRQHIEDAVHELYGR